MSTLKLDVGRPLVLVIDDVATVDGKFGKQTAFHAGDDTFYMSVESAQRQLAKAGVTEVVGSTLEFTKVPIAGGKTAINIRDVSGGAGNASQSRQNAPSSHVPGPPENSLSAYAKGEDTLTRYEHIVDIYCTKIIPKLKAAGVPIDHQGTSAAIAAILIDAGKR